jgi:hypothetical protein
MSFPVSISLQTNSSAMMRIHDVNVVDVLHRWRFACTTIGTSPVSRCYKPKVDGLYLGLSRATLEGSVKSAQSSAGGQSLHTPILNTKYAQ